MHDKFKAQSCMTCLLRATLRAPNEYWWGLCDSPPVAASMHACNAILQSHTYTAFCLLCMVCYSYNTAELHICMSCGCSPPVSQWYACRLTYQMWLKQNPKVFQILEEWSGLCTLEQGVATAKQRTLSQLARFWSQLRSFCLVKVMDQQPTVWFESTLSVFVMSDCPH